MGLVISLQLNLSAFSVSTQHETKLLAFERCPSLLELAESSDAVDGLRPVRLRGVLRWSKDQGVGESKQLNVLYQPGGVLSHEYAWPIQQLTP